MKTAIWTEHFAELGIENALEFAASLGYKAVEITPWLHDGPDPIMSEVTIERITSAVDRHGLEVAGTTRGFGLTTTTS